MQTCVAGGVALAATGSELPGAWADEPAESPAHAGKALVAITLDLEMSRNFPRWEDTHWDYAKGLLDEPTKRYAVAAAKRVRAAGGVIHFFAVGRVCEQENVDWLREIAAAGHPIGNHTYDHVNVLATRSEDLQFRFQRAPWLIAGRTPAEVIAENIRLTNVALQERAGIKAVGFRTPGGFAAGLAGREDLQHLLLEQGFDWVSSKYPAHPNTKDGASPDASVLEGIVAAQAAAQPFVYPTGLIEVPMSPISDIGAFRNGRWPLDDFLAALERALEWTIRERATFDFLAHPSCLGVVDPEFQALDLIVRTVERHADEAALVDLRALAARARKTA
ncbi:MAG: polysaccharide deacetylase family protein [Pirellulales bacterium]|nr:polysaccharide deacetylase family protein [Pirellulales bacterium]